MTTSHELVVAWRQLRETETALNRASAFLAHARRNVQRAFPDAGVDLKEDLAPIARPITTDVTNLQAGDVIEVDWNHLGLETTERGTLHGIGGRLMLGSRTIRTERGSVNANLVNVRVIP